MIYANNDNVWCSTGGRPQAVGNDIVELIRNSDSTKWDSGVTDSEYNLYLGATSANGITYTNCLASLDLRTASWRWRELADGLGSLCRVRRSEEDYLYLGGATGKVYVKGRYKDTVPATSDDGNPFLGWFRTKAFDLSDPTVQKNIVSTIFYSERAGGLKAYFRTLDTNQKELTPWKEIGCLDQVINRFEKNITGYFLQFEFKDYTQNPYFRFYGLTALLAQASRHD